MRILGGEQRLLEVVLLGRGDSGIDELGGDRKLEDREGVEEIGGLAVIGKGE